MVSILCLILIVLAVVWVIAQFLPNTGRLAQIALILWVLLATFALCGFHINAD